MDGYLTILSNTGRLNEAVKFCKDLLTDHPDQNEIRMRYGELLYQTAARDEALGELEKALQGFLLTKDEQKVARCVQILSTVNPSRSAEYRALLQQG